MGLLDKAKELGGKGLVAAKDAAEKGKVKLAIVEAEGNITKILKQVAEDLLKNKVSVLEENYPEELKKILELKAKIEELKGSAPADVVAEAEAEVKAEEE